MHPKLARALIVLLVEELMAKYSMKIVGPPGLDTRAFSRSDDAKPQALVGKARPRSRVHVVRLCPIVAVTAMPRKGSSVGFQGASVNVS